MTSRNGAYPASASLSGRHGGRFQSCPCWLKASGGAPPRTSAAKTSRTAQVSAPPGCPPTGRSCTIPTVIPASRGFAGRFQLRPAEVLQPGVEADALLQLPAGLLDLGPGRVSQGLRPLPPVGAVLFGEGAEEG